MRTIVLACRAIEDEITVLCKSLNQAPEMVWLEGGWHNNPVKLRARLQEILAWADGRCQRLLVTLGYCGGALSELKTGDYQLVAPMVDDCLTLLLGSLAARKRASKPPAYFLTAGWLRHENNLIEAYSRAVAAYGLRRAVKLNRLMLKNYQRFAFVRTEAYDLESCAARVEPLAKTLKFMIESVRGDLSWLRDLLLGPHDDRGRFLVLPPRSEIGYEQWADFLIGAWPGQLSDQGSHDEFWSEDKKQDPGPRAAAET
ncbi:MAG: DUF1638 domain-containing protein [Deltaproteobacteria bacterium]|nr:DUF1638 domain-containing protein [Deltaproteobacteria bacterium]